MQQQTLTVAIQGERASFHEIGAENYYTQPITLTYCQSFEETFELLSTGSVDRAFVAVRNSSHGEIVEVKALLQKHNPAVEGEYYLPIQQHLIGIPGTRLEDIKTIMSHPVALSQCDAYLNSVLFDREWLHYHDTAAAVERVKVVNSKAMAAIGSEAAAKLHGLALIQEAIQNDSNNTTTFLSLIRKAN